MTSGEQANCACDKARTEQIAKLNDALRKTLRGGIIVATKGVRELPHFDPRQLMALLANYDAFDDDNNPYGERDFGDIELNGKCLLWKIDYYDIDLLCASPAPHDPDQTKRVLTVMLQEEW